MKKFSLLILSIILFNCSGTKTPEDAAQELEDATTDVEIIFTTSEPNHDEIMVTYYDIKQGKDITQPYVFEYDQNGNSLPLKIIFDNYEYRFLDGETFRNNFSESELRVQVYFEGNLHSDEASYGTSNSFARVNFSFKIP